MPRISRILVPIDFSEGSRAAADSAASMAKAFDAAVELMHVWELPVFVTPDLLVTSGSDARATIAEYTRRRAAQELEEWQTRLAAQGLTVSTTLVRGDAATEICERATHGCDLIVMGTHGRTGVTRILLGSVTEKVVRKAPCPVLTVRLQAAEPAVATP